MNIGFIGLGHMAGSILKALSNSEEYDFYVNDHHEDRLLDLQKSLGDKLHISNYDDIFSSCPFIFLGVKPKDMTPLLERIKEVVSSQVLISMAAGYSMKEIYEVIGKAKLIRIMPNTPVAVRKGV
ncbi:MAG: NAD(P)-binding domain-containing protein, partial [Bacilli bacterium]|nr:NAD(P)-binding domain-containing protein [Bacilli bacterium]